MDFTEIVDLCNSLLCQHGFEWYPFQIGWYNSSIVSERYRLNYDDDSLAIMVISAPRMFETTFLPWLRDRKHNLSEIIDPIDDCMRQFFGHFQKKIDTVDMEIIHDFEMRQGRYPRVLMNTAGHVSGAANYYQKSDLNGEYSDKKLFGVSVHSKYGGWFAFRAVLIFPRISAADLQRPVSQKKITSTDDVFNLLHSFTYEWKVNEWRDAFMDVEEKYSPMQKDYFSRLPAERHDLLKKWVADGLI